MRLVIVSIDCSNSELTLSLLLLPVTEEFPAPVFRMPQVPLAASVVRIPTVIRTFYRDMKALSDCVQIKTGHCIYKTLVYIPSFQVDLLVMMNWQHC